MARNVIVTGGGTGIGRAVAASFAATGDTVVILGRRPEPLHRAAAQLGPAVRAVVCDATDPAQVETLRTQLPTTVDVLVNSAGGNTDLDRPSSDDLASLAASWRANLEANLLSAVLITAVVADRLTEGGAVISISSIAADKGAGAYGAAKAALASAFTSSALVRSEIFMSRPPRSGRVELALQQPPARNRACQLVSPVRSPR
ncbi:MAG TPA: SDR family NAD(P)-dependent oxidoreductase [Pseudonocardiaceae bacterium]|nr:SDR family NAD(P)-dependent oxidoreductase [Pseudonocardiaceae bacterium]